jgi:hypothetical protein
VPILHAGTSLGCWMAANWDPRRFLPPYAERFVEALAGYTRRYPGEQFRHAPPVQSRVTRVSSRPRGLRPSPILASAVGGRAAAFTPVAAVIGEDHGVVERERRR